MNGQGKIGVLLINLGSPDKCETKNVRRYLKEFLWDKRVVEVPRLIWWFVLNGPILLTRPAKSAQKYQQIWDKRSNSSPLINITRQSAAKLAGNLTEHEQIKVDWAMRYGNPSISSRIEKMMDEGIERILLFSLYPQYSATTTASVMDAAGEALKKMRHQPSLRFVPPYYDEPLYIKALAATLDDELQQLDFTPEVIIASYHGIPQAYADKGDPYPQHCQATHKLLKKALGDEGFRLLMTYQSRFGPKQWLQPYTDKTLEELASSGVKNVAVLMPGFAADCLETLEEIAIENAEIFKRAGGQKFAAIPCLNDSAPAIDMMRHLTLRELQGWLDK